ncbi:hypothetical protein [Actinoplanes utahensis]|uniref:Uncharacterized protein n=1 Tax=Actinoplanes utahensis TaxID=1869 RepID=A0A0A6UP99_ACTUT|nr:hypothetical protein [Actinoplanes utahensis]KHD77256.1 hypothetical protein MB27_12635 [Actinoplanes utahensis]GIF33488.1 hypothetical protein Aut01nite_64740 [Actinoplanes utahensis]
MTAYPARMRRPGRSAPGGRAAMVMLLLLLTAVALFPVDRDHHHTVASHDHPLTAAACVTQHHHTGEPVPDHGHRHTSDVVSNLAPRSRTDAPDGAVLIVTIACGSAADSPAPPSSAAPPVPADVDLHLLGVLRV